MIALEEGADKLPVDPVKGSAARKRGRGTRRMIQSADLVPRRRHPEGRPHIVTLRLRSAALGSVRELMVHERARCCGGKIVAGLAPRAVRLHVWSLRKRCAKLMDWMGGDPALATAITSMGDLPSTPDLVEVRACLQRVSRRVLQEEDRGRLEASKESMNRKWTTRR